MIKGVALLPGSFNLVAENILPNGTIVTSIQSRQVALLYSALTSLHPPDTPDHSGLLDAESDIELEDLTMGCARAE